MPDLSLPSLRLDGLGRGVPEYGKLGNLGRQHFNASHVPDQSMPPCRSRHLSRPGARHKTSRAHAHKQAYRLSSHTVGPGLQMSSLVPFHRQQLPTARSHNANIEQPTRPDRHIRHMASGVTGRPPTLTRATSPADRQRVAPNPRARPASINICSKSRQS